MKAKITVLTIRRLAEEFSQDKRLSDTEIRGFHAKRLKSGVYFYLSYSNQQSKKRTLAIGHHPTITPEQARVIVKQYLGRIAQGEDVQATIVKEKEKQHELDTLTVKAYLNKIYSTTLDRKKSGTTEYQKLTNHFSCWDKKIISEITPQDLLRWQIEKETEGIKFKTMQRVYASFKAMLNHAVKMDSLILIYSPKSV
jgi:hypothetical protein